LLALAGLAIFNIFVGSLENINKSPLIFGPIFAFAVSLSDISLLGFGSFFWGLVLGTLVSWLWEREGLEQIWTKNSHLE
jgi:predicted benzoate:H+ symporter BenE